MERIEGGKDKPVNLGVFSEQDAGGQISPIKIQKESSTRPQVKRGGSKASGKVELALPIWQFLSK